MKLLIYLWIFVAVSNAYHTHSKKKILLYPFAHCVNSHLLNMEKLAAILQSGDYEVSMLVPTHYTGPYANANLSIVQFLKYDYPQLPYHTDICEFQTLDKFLAASFREILHVFYSATYLSCETLIQQKQLLQEIKFQLHFDLIIYDAVDQCSKVLADYLDVPFIVFHTSGMESILPRNPAYLPSMVTTFTDCMNLKERVLNTFGYLLQKFIAYRIYSSYQELRVKYGFNASLNIHNTFDRASLRFILAEGGIDYVGPIQPTYIKLGGVIQVQQRYVPLREQPFQNQNPYTLCDTYDGTIVFSFGSITRQFGVEWREKFAEAFRSLPYNVIWRYDDDEDRPLHLGNNTCLVHWLPQLQILQDSKTRVFITHAGMNAVYEAAYAGVPVITIPLFGDQFFQSAKLVKHLRMGIQLDIYEIFKNPKVLTETVLEVAENQDYRLNARLAASISNVKPFSQTEVILRWTQYVIAHGGAPHLHCKEHQLTWYEYYLVDVFAVIFVITVTILQFFRISIGLAIQYLRTIFLKH